MPLNIHIEAEPESMFDFAKWLRSAGRRVEFWASAGPRSARTESEHGWTGSAAEGFRAIAYRLGTEGDTLSEGWTGVAEVTEAHAHDIVAVRNKMGDARDIAARAGLGCTDREIADPGMPPEKPNLGVDGDNAEQAMAKAEARAAWHAWHDKAEAYTKAATLVTEARRIEQDSQDKVLALAEGVSAGGAIITTASFLNGVAAGFLSRQTEWRGNVDKFTDIANKARLADAAGTVPAGARGSNLLHGLMAQAKAEVAETRANTNHIGRWLERLPERPRNIITRQLGQFIPRNATYLAKAPEVLKRISAVGGGLSGLATAVQIAEGKDPAKAITSNGLGLLAGTAAGLLATGPLAAVGAFLIGTGTTMVTDEALHPDDPDHVDVIAPGPGDIPDTGR